MEGGESVRRFPTIGPSKSLNSYLGDRSWRTAVAKVLRMQKQTPLQRLEDPPPGVPRYTINGEAYFSVTQVMDDGRFDRLDPIRMIQSQILGSVVHLQIENVFKGRPLDYYLSEALDPNQQTLYHSLKPQPDSLWEEFRSGWVDPQMEEIFLHNRIQTAYAQFLEWRERFNPELVMSEDVLWHPEYLYAGTVDLVCVVDDTLTIVDHKTSRFVNPDAQADDTYTAQLSAYLKAIEYLGDETLDCKLSILHLDPMATSYRFVERRPNFPLFLQKMADFSTRAPGERPSEGENEPSSSENILLQFKCSCGEVSTFPFPADPTPLAKNQVKRMVKVSWHEEAVHYAIHHINVPSYKLDKVVFYNPTGP